MKVPGDEVLPPGVVTATDTELLPAGETAVIWVAELTVKLVASVPPNVTDVAPVRFVPVMMTDVPPAAGPDVGARPVIGRCGDVGEVADRGRRCRRPWSRETVTAPLPAGATAVIWVAELTTKLRGRGGAELHRSCAGEVGAGDDDARCRQPPGRRSGRSR